MARRPPDYEAVLEDYEFLLDAGVIPEEAARRVGYATLSGFRKACTRGERPDLWERTLRLQDEARSEKWVSCKWRGRELKLERERERG